MSWVPEHDSNSPIDTYHEESYVWGKPNAPVAYAKVKEFRLDDVNADEAYPGLSDELQGISLHADPSEVEFKLRLVGETSEFPDDVKQFLTLQSGSKEVEIKDNSAPVSNTISNQMIYLNGTENFRLKII